MNTSQEIKNLWAKIRDEGDGVITVQEFLDKHESTAMATPNEIVNAFTSLKNEALKLGETPLGLKYYAEAKLMENIAMPLVNETVAAEIEDRMISLQRRAVTLVGAAMKKLVLERNKQLEELRLVNKTFDKMTGGIKGVKKIFKKISSEQDKLLDVVGTVSFSAGPKIDRDLLETVVEQWRTDLAKFNGQAPQEAQAKS